jgi:endonuclease YncB( thermonuclease family)
LKACVAALASISLVTIVLGGSPAIAEIVGRATVIDGGTIEIGGRRIRLYGIEAPANDRLCGVPAWRCGQESTFALARIIETHWVYCAERGHDELGGVVAVCRLSGANGPEVNAAMVREGWAVALRAQSTDYVAAEAEARSAKSGLWRGGGLADWDRRPRDP